MSLLIHFAFVAIILVVAAAVPLEDASDNDNVSTNGEKSDTKYILVDDITKCNQDDEKLGDCIKRTMNIVFKRLKDGDPELNIPAYDPFVMNRTTFQYTNGPVNGRITAKNVNIYGFVDFQIKMVDLKINNDKMKLRMVSHLPKMNIEGLYKADMTFNTVHVKPKGEFNVTLLDVEINARAQGDVYKMDGHRFVRLSEFHADPKVGDLQIKATGIFPDPALDEIVLNVANQYWRDIYSIMLPETRQFWGPLVLRVINQALKSVPIDAYIKE